MLRVLAFGVVALSLSAAGRADDSKPSESSEPQSPSELKKHDPNLLIGKWVRTDKCVGTTLEYGKNGTYSTTAVLVPGAKPTTMGGTWKREGDRLVQTLGPSRTNTSVTITKLSETEFHFRNHAGQEATFERAAEKKK
jgi:uncharacterized protein (TIGR03066 family)